VILMALQESTGVKTRSPFRTGRRLQASSGSVILLAKHQTLAASGYKFPLEFSKYYGY
jgi:hypothetical protein